MKITILDLTEHPLPLLEGLPTVGVQIANWLRPALPDAQFETAHIAEGEAFPDLSSVEALVVSGSEYGVYDETPWMQPLRGYVMAVKAAGKPIYGICFGHQIMADLFGGKAELGPVGNQVGTRRYAKEGAEFDANAWHKDQVTRVPPDAQVTASAAYCPVAALDYDFPAKSVQFHPEYTQDHLRDIFDRFEGGFLKSEEVAAAKESFIASDVRADEMALEAAAFFKAHLERV